MSYIFGGNTGMSYDDMQRRRAVAEALAQRVGGQAPQNVGQGLAMVGAALASRRMRKQAAEAESAQRAAAAEQFGKIAQGAGLSPDMAQALNNPYFSDGQNAVLKALIAQKIPQQVQPTDDMREYQFSQKDPAFAEYMLNMKKAGSSQTNIEMKGEGKYAEELGKADAERFIGMQKEAQAGQRTLNSLSAMEGLMGQEGFYSGIGGEGVKAAKRLGSAMGMDAQGIDSMEAFNSLAKSSALDVMGGSLGTGFSNADRDFVVEQVPNLGNTPQGNKAIIGIQRKIAGRKIEIAKMARDYAKRNDDRLDAGFDEELAQWAEANPLFTAEDMPAEQQGGLPQGVTEEDIQFTMQKHGLTREQVLQKLGGQ